MKLGSTQINKMYLGSTEIKKAYLGSTLVFDKTGGGPVVPGFIGALDAIDNLYSVCSFKRISSDWSGALCCFQAPTPYLSLRRHGTAARQPRLNNPTRTTS